jgi:hypothetical protein
MLVRHGEREQSEQRLQRQLLSVARVVEALEHVYGAGRVAGVQQRVRTRALCHDVGGAVLRIERERARARERERERESRERARARKRGRERDWCLCSPQNRERERERARA